MFCKHCGAENLQDSKYCHKCGKPIPTLEQPKPITPYKDIDPPFNYLNDVKYKITGRGIAISIFSIFAFMILFTVGILFIDNGGFEEEYVPPEDGVWTPTSNNSGYVDNPLGPGYTWEDYDDMMDTFGVPESQREQPDW